MKGFIYIFMACAAALTSCAEQCNIVGNSSIGGLDGQMLYLRVTQDGSTVTYQDSCEVIHGRFSFYSELDSTIVAQLYMGNERLMPVVLEEGNLDVRVDHVGQSVKGGATMTAFTASCRKRAGSKTSSGSSTASACA